MFVNGIGLASFVEGRDQERGIHLTGRRAGDTAAQADVAALVLTHLPAWNDPDVVLAEAESTFSGPVSLAAPGQTHDLQGCPERMSEISE